MVHPFFDRPTAALLLVLAAFGAFADPRSALLHTAKQDARAGEVFQVDGSLTGSVAFEKLVLRFRGRGEEYVAVKMDLQYGDLYRGTIPAARMRPPGIEYWVEGVTSAGDRMAIFMTADAPARVRVSSEDALSDGVVKEGPYDEPMADPAKKPTKKKCKKNDKKCREEHALIREAENEEEPKRIEEPSKEQAKVEEPKTEVAKKPEPVAAPKTATEETGRKPEPRRKRSEIEEELAIYGAEDSTGVVSRIDDKGSPVPQWVSSYDVAALKQLGARTVYDVLDLIPGLTVSRDVQGFHRLAVRGRRSDPEVLFLLDGHKLNSFYDGRALANLPIDNLEKIEVFRGPATADFELGNFGAIVKLVTRRDDGIRASASAGLWDAYQGHLNVAKAFGGLKLYVDGDVAKQVGYRKAVLKDALELSTIAQGKRLAQDPAGRTNDNRLLVNVGGGVEYVREGFGKIRLGARFLLESRGALIGQYDTVGAESKLDWATLQVDLAFYRRVGDASQFHLRVFLDQQSTRRHFQLSPREFQINASNVLTMFPEGIVEEVAVNTRTLGAEGTVELALPANNRLSLGVSAQLSSLIGYDYLTNYEPGTNFYKGPALARPAGLLYPTEGTAAAAARLGLGFFVQDVFTPFERLTIQVGFRADVIQLPTSNGSALTGTAFAAGFGPRAGIAFAAINSLALKAHYGRAFRAPTPQELSETIPNSDSNQGRSVGNPALTPGTVDSVEAGFEYVQTVGDARVKLSAAGFFQNFTQPIQAVDTSGNLVPYTNRHQGVRVAGAEGEARVELSLRSAFFINASFFRAEDNATVPAARLLTDLPQARLNAGFSLPIGPYLNLDVTTRLGAERRNNSRSTLELIRRYRLPGYVLVGAALRTEPIFDHVELSIVGQNVFDFDHSDDVPRPDRITAGVPREGVVIFASVKVDF